MRTFQDRNFLVWEAYPSGGRHGFAADPNIIFHCVTQRNVRSRFLETGGDGLTAERRLADATPAELLEMLEQAQELA